jgi:hypothetical protein
MQKIVVSFVFLVFVVDRFWYLTIHGNINVLTAHNYYSPNNKDHA